MPILVLRNVNGLNLEVQDRELVVLAGPIGCGSRAILRMIAGLDPATNGEIFIGERRVNDLPPKERDVAMVCADYAPYPGMSVEENLALSLTSRKFSESEIKKRVSAAADILRLGEILGRKPEGLSGEQRQQVAVARALVRQPKLFLFDGPCAGLGATEGMALRDEIRKLHQRGQGAILYATHDPAEAMALGGRLVILDNGIVQQEGGASALYEAPANLFVAGFLGQPQMNLIRGTLKQDRDSLVFREADEGTIELRLPSSAYPAGAGPVVLGIHPENVAVMPPTPGGEKRGFRALVESIEPTGPEALLHLQTGANKLVSRTSHQLDSAEAGHRFQFEINPEKAHLFDPVSTRRIDRPG